MLVDLRADSVAWQAEKKKQKSSNAATATKDVYPGKQPDMSYQEYLFQFGCPNSSPAWTERDYSPTYGPIEEPNIPSLHSDRVSSDSISRNLSADQESQLGTDSFHGYKPPYDLHMNKALEGGTYVSGQSTIAREVIPRHNSLQGPGFGIDEKPFKPWDASAAGSQFTRN